jgi:hypothetical protein
MEKTLTLTLDLRPPATADADDTAAHILTEGQTPAAMARLFQVAPHVAIKLTLPDPPRLDVTLDDQDVLGYWWPFFAGLGAGAFVGATATAAADALGLFDGHIAYHKYN